MFIFLLYITGISLSILFLCKFNFADFCLGSVLSLAPLSSLLVHIRIKKGLDTEANIPSLLKIPFAKKKFKISV